ncbi:FcoT family thioesterase [Scytonema sp. NUACC21]
MDINQRFIKEDDVDIDLLNSILLPYKDDCKYLKKAKFQYLEPKKLVSISERNHQGLWFTKGYFSIPESCYIADTGHFNAVEYNICYNQLGYTMVAHLLENKLLKGMESWNIATYKERQLPDFLIVKFSSTFKKPINSSLFQGTFSIYKYSVRDKLIMLKTECAFYDNNGGWAEGDATVAILNNYGKKATEPLQLVSA